MVIPLVPHVHSQIKNFARELAVSLAGARAVPVRVRVRTLQSHDPCSAVSFVNFCKPLAGMSAVYLQNVGFILALIVPVIISTTWPVPYKRYDSRPISDPFCKAGVIAFCPTGQSTKTLV